jgi:hypothetical protein
MTPDERIAKLEQQLEAQKQAIEYLIKAFRSLHQVVDALPVDKQTLQQALLHVVRAEVTLQEAREEDADE